MIPEGPTKFMRKKEKVSLGIKSEGGDVVHTRSAFEWKSVDSNKQKTGREESIRKGKRSSWRLTHKAVSTSDINCGGDRRE